MHFNENSLSVFQLSPSLEYLQNFNICKIEKLTFLEKDGNH